MKGSKSVYLLVFALILIIGACSGRSNSLDRSAEGYHVLNQLHDTLSTQSFTFDGSTSLNGEDFNANNIATFTGHMAKNRDLYLNLTTAKEENGIMEDMDYFAKENKIYMRFADEVDWQPVLARSPLIEDEVNHWNPVAHFERMSNMAQSIRHLGGGKKIESIRVVLQPDQLKNEFLQNIRDRLKNPDLNQNGVSFQSLSTGVAGEKGVIDELSAVQETIQKDFDEMADTLSMSGEYIINYDARYKFPTSLTYIQKAEYTEGGERQTETSKLRMTFRDFGKEVTVPGTSGLE
jgi:hypothetical protein